MASAWRSKIQVKSSMDKYFNILVESTKQGFGLGFISFIAFFFKREELVMMKSVDILIQLFVSFSLFFIIGTVLSFFSRIIFKQ